MLDYICITVILIIFIPILYVRIRYPFWSTQPVFHTYDALRYFTRTPYEISSSNVSQRSIVSDPHVTTCSFLDMSENKLDEVIDLIQGHSIESESILMFIDKTNFNIIHSGQMRPSYISVYEKEEYSIVHSDVEQENNAISIKNTPKIVGCITSRSINMFILDKSDAIHAKSGYLWDYICVHRENKMGNLGRKMLPIHSHYQREHTKEVAISLFKKEIDLCDGVVPLVKYKVYTFTMTKIRRPPISPPYATIRINNENMDLLSDYLYNITHTDYSKIHRFIAFPDMAVLDKLIQANILLVYAMKYGASLHGIYVFRNPMMCYDKIENGYILECIMGISTVNIQDEPNTSLFFSGFLQALVDIQKSFASKYKMLTFYELGHNRYIIDRWKWKYAPLSVNDAAYYLYNAVVPDMPLDTSQCMIII